MTLISLGEYKMMTLISLGVIKDNIHFAWSGTKKITVISTGVEKK